MAFAQPNSSNFQVIPKADNSEGFVKFYGQKLPSGFKVSVGAPAGLTADYTMIWPDTPTDGFIYYDSMTGLLSFTGAGTCGADCMTLTTNQNASGVKTFTSGIIMQGTSTVETLQMGASFAFTIGTDQVTMDAAQLLIENGTAGQSRAILGGFDGVGPVVSYGGRLALYQIDGTTLKVHVGHTDAALLESLNGYSVGGTTVIDGSRALDITAFTMATGASTGYCLTSDGVGVGTWQVCGSGGGNFVTTNTNQVSGLTGNKLWSGVHQFQGGVYVDSVFQVLNSSFIKYLDIDPNAPTMYLRRPISTGAGNAIRVALGSFTGLGTDSGRVQTFTGNAGSETVVNKMDADGFDTTEAYYAGGFLVIDNNANGTFATLASENLTLTGGSTFIDISSRMVMNSTSMLGKDATLAQNLVQILWSLGAGGVVATGNNAGTSQNALSQFGIWTSIGYGVGSFVSPTIVIDASGNAVFPSLRITTAPSTGYILTSDASGNATWQAPAGGSFVTTNTNQLTLSGNKSTSGIWAFTGGITVQQTSTARNWLPESTNAYTNGSDSFAWQEMYSRAYYIGNGAGLDLMELGPTLVSFGNGTVSQYRAILGGFDGVGPVVSYGGRIALYKIDGTTLKFHVGHLDSAQAESVNGYSVGGISRIDASGNVNANTFSAASGSITSGGLSVIGNTIVTGNFTVTGSCTGCSSITNYVTTNTNQTSGLTGGKIWTGAHTFSNNSFTILTSGGQTYWVDDTANGASTLYNTSGAQRVRIARYTGLFVDSGELATYSASGLVNYMNSGGIGTTVGYDANGNAGQTDTVTVRDAAGTGTCTLVFTMGLKTGGTCP